MTDPVQDPVSDLVQARDDEPDVEAHGGIVNPVEDFVQATDDEPDVEAHGGIVNPVEDVTNTPVVE